MPFPLSVVGTFDIPRQSPEGDVRDQTLKAASVALGVMRVHVRQQEGTVLGYRDFYDWWRSMQTNSGHPLGAFNKVSLSVGGCAECATVEYRLSTRILLAFISCAVIPFGVIGFAAGGPRGELADHLLVGALLASIGWAWLFGMNYLLGWLRGPRWLHARIVEQVAAANEGGIELAR